MSEYTLQEPIVITGTTTMANAKWEENNSSYGGAVNIQSTGNLILDHTAFADNGASGFGGAVFNEGTLSAIGGIEFTGNTAEWGGGAIYTKKTLTLTAGSFCGNTANTGGAIGNYGTATIDRTSFTENTADYGGAVFNGESTALSFDEVTFAGNSAFLGGGILNYGTVTVTNTAFNGNIAEAAGGAIYNFDSGKITLKNVSFQTAEDTIVNEGTMTFEGVVSLAGSVVTGSVIKADGATILWDIHSYEAANSQPIIDDLGNIVGAAGFGLSVAVGQTAGKYVLAANAAAFSSSIALECDAFEPMALAKGQSITYHNGNYTLDISAGKLSVEINEYKINGSVDRLSWDSINSAESYDLEISNGTAAAAIALNTAGAELLGIAAGDYAWQVRNSSENDNWQIGNDFSVADVASEPQKLSAVSNDATDLFFARVDGVWEHGYLAKNVGNLTWEGTGEIVELEGKRRITDIFAGSDDASILVMDAFNGDAAVRAAAKETGGMALFVDDVYSAAADSAEQARLSNIDTIIATEGDDVIDLTSQRFAFDGGVAVHGGNGNDVIWANCGENTLFGGAGDDSIVGGSGDDVIIGGAGNDTLHGGGGTDIFCFAGDWGQDTVAQLDGGDFRLWFDDGIEKNMLSVTQDGMDTRIELTGTDNSIVVSNATVAAVEDRLLFGSDAAFNGMTYSALASLGAFV